MMASKQIASMTMTKQRVSAVNRLPIQCTGCAAGLGVVLRDHLVHLGAVGALGGRDEERGEDLVDVRDKEERDEGEDDIDARGERAAHFIFLGASVISATTTAELVTAGSTKLLSRSRAHSRS